MIVVVVGKYTVDLVGYKQLLRETEIHQRRPILVTDLSHIYIHLTA
jgi:hypothetical protein